MVNWKEEVRAALSRASDEGRVQQIAREIGVKPGALHQFTSKGSLNPNAVFALDRWLIANGYKEPSGERAPPESPREQTLRERTVEELTRLIGVLESPHHSDVFKARQLVSWVESAHDDIEFTWGKLLKKGTNR